MTRRLVIVTLAGALAFAAAPAAWADVSVSLDRSRVATKLGHTFVFHSTIANRGSAPLRGLIAHLNVLSLRGGVYVDPEDWSSHRTRYLQPIAPGGSRTLLWRIKAVNAGSIGIYVAVVPRVGAAPPTTGPTLRVAIADRKTLNSGGIVPLALAVPGSIGLAWLILRRARTRRPVRRTSRARPAGRACTTRSTSLGRALRPSAPPARARAGRRRR
jgi:hypothetical protein